MGSLQEALKKIESTDGVGGIISPRLPSNGQALAEMTPIPVSAQDSLAGYAQEVDKVCGHLAVQLQQMTAHLDRYAPAPFEAKLSTGRSYRDLKSAVKGLQDRLVQVRRLAADISTK